MWLTTHRGIKYYSPTVHRSKKDNSIFLTKKDQEVIKDLVKIGYNIYDSHSRQWFHSCSFYVEKENAENTALLIIEDWNTASFRDVRNISYQMDKETRLYFIKIRIKETRNNGEKE